MHSHLRQVNLEAREQAIRVQSSFYDIEEEPQYPYKKKRKPPNFFLNLEIDMIWIIPEFFSVIQLSEGLAYICPGVLFHHGGWSVRGRGVKHLAI